MAMQAVLDGVGIAVEQLAYVGDALAAGRLVAPFPIVAHKSESWFLEYRPVRREEPSWWLSATGLLGEAATTTLRGSRVAELFGGTEAQAETAATLIPVAAVVQVFGRRNAKPIRALGRPASEKRQGTKSRWVGHWRCRGLYGELSGASGSKRTRRSGPTHGFDPRRGCRCGAERADRRFVDRNGAGGAGRSDGPTQAGAMPVEIRREWLVSLRFRIGNDGIMRCRS